VQRQRRIENKKRCGRRLNIEHKDRERAKKGLGRRCDNGDRNTRSLRLMLLHV